MPGIALAQWDTHWNESGPHPDGCLYNGVQFYPGDEVCVRPRASQACGLDGTFGPIEAAPDCKAPQGAERSIIGHSEPGCLFGGKRFSVGAEVCSAPGAKLACKASGAFSAPLREANCPAALSTKP